MLSTDFLQYSSLSYIQEISKCPIICISQPSLSDPSSSPANPLRLASCYRHRGGRQDSGGFVRLPAGVNHCLECKEGALTMPLTGAGMLMPPKRRVLKDVL